MIVRITNASKGKPFTFDEPLCNQSGDMKIAIKRITVWSGWYNIYEKTTVRWGRNEQESQELPIEPGFYNFNHLTKIIMDGIENLSITVNPESGLVDITLPPNIELWLPDPVRYALGIDGSSWINTDYVGDRPVELAPKRILIYLKQLSTTGNYHNQNQNLRGSQLLEIIPISPEPFGKHSTFNFDNPDYIPLNSGDINELDFDFKVEWGNGVTHKLDNNLLPIDLNLEIKSI